MSVSDYWALTVLCVFLCVCVCVCVCVSVCVCVWDIKSDYDAKTHIMCQDLLLTRLEMCRSIGSLIKIAHQMWRNHPFS